MRALVSALLALVVVGSIVIAVSVYRFVTVGVPDLEGTRHVSGVNKPVSVFFDSFGIPHVYADSLDDMSYTMGYLHAADRLFQMDLGRRNASGRLAELLGKDLVERDKFRRILGLHRMAEKAYAELTPELRSSLEKYAAGVNAYAKESEKIMPLEYRLLGVDFAPWEPTDSLVMGFEMGWMLSGNLNREITRWLISQERSIEDAYALMPRHIDSGPFIIPPSMRKYSPLPTRSMNQYDGSGVMENLPALNPVAQKALAELNAWESSIREKKFASNSWIIAGKHTKSGKPILANDPHLEHRLPSIWYEAHLNAPGLNLAGVMFPGTPLLILGHSEKIAWGATTTMADTQDLYIERPNPTNASQYEYDGAFENFREIVETIKYCDAERKFHEEKMTVRLSRHGPIINSMRPALMAEGVPPMALRWAFYDHPPNLSAMLEVSMATNWDEFKAGIGKLGSPIQNWVYADVDGNIGYIAAGTYPVRAPGHDGTFPVPGWTSKYEWRGTIPQEQQPQVYNPERGFVVTANNKVVPEDDYPFIVSHAYAPPYRAARITELIEEEIKQGDITLEDVMRIQNDVMMLQAKRLVPVFVDAISPLDAQTKSKYGSRATDALDALKEWDFVADTESVGSSVFHQIRQEAKDLILEDELSPELYAGYKNWMTNTLDNILSSDSEFFDDRKTADYVETRDDILQTAFRRALDKLTLALGEDVSMWQWGKLHTLTFPHPFSLAEPRAGRFLNVGPMPHQGSRTTVMNASWFSEPFKTRAGPSMRHVIDMGDVEGARITNTLGQSGHRFSDHYSDQVKMWQAGEYHAMPMRRDAVERASVKQLVLMPE